MVFVPESILTEFFGSRRSPEVDRQIEVGTIRLMEADPLPFTRIIRLLLISGMSWNPPSIAAFDFNNDSLIQIYIMASLYGLRTICAQTLEVFNFESLAVQDFMELAKSVYDHGAADQAFREFFMRNLAPQLQMTAKGKTTTIKSGWVRAIVSPKDIAGVIRGGGDFAADTTEALTTWMVWIMSAKDNVAENDEANRGLGHPGPHARAASPRSAAPAPPNEEEQTATAISFHNAGEGGLEFEPGDTITNIVSENQVWRSSC